MKRVFFALAIVILSMSSYSQTAIHIVKKGNGNPVIFLPGFTSPGSVWNETIENLNGQYENHIVSYAGFNGLKPIIKPWYDPIKDQLIDYIKNEGFSNLTIIGHSMGGNLAIDIAAALPDQISKLILVESIPCMRELMMPGVPESMIQYDNPYNIQMLAMSDSAFRKMAAGMAQFMTFDQSKIELLTQWIVVADRETYVYGYTDLLKLDFRNKLSKINPKTLILGASFPNIDIVKANYDKQYANLKFKEILIVENSKHFIMFDQPKWLVEKLNTFMNSNE